VGHVFSHKPANLAEQHQAAKPPASSDADASVGTSTSLAGSTSSALSAAESVAGCGAGGAAGGALPLHHRVCGMLLEHVCRWALQSSLPARWNGQRRHALLSCCVEPAHHLVKVWAQLFERLASVLRFLSFRNDPLHSAPWCTQWCADQEAAQR
jgi:hypothetical protein